MASFPRLVAIFYAIFDPDKGAEIQVQSPDEAFNPQSPLFDFSSVSEFIIPKKEMCNQILSFITPSGYRIVGHPVHIPGSKYKRNFFVYNLAFVFEENAEIGSYNPVVRRLAMTFKQLEVSPTHNANLLYEQSRFLSTETTRPLLHNVIENIFEDLNCYCECMSPISNSPCCTV